MDCCHSESSVHGILQARILEWVAIPFSWGSSLPRDQTRDSYVSWTGRWVLYYYCHWGSPNLFFREDCKYQKPTVKWDIYKPAEVPRQRNTIETGGSYQKVPDLKQKQTLSASANFFSPPQSCRFYKFEFQCLIEGLEGHIPKDICVIIILNYYCYLLLLLLLLLLLDL